MGLDAVVFRSRANLPFDPDAEGAILDRSTGEWCVVDLEVDIELAFEQKFPWETRIAADKRIGNIALVQILREQASLILGDGSIVLSKVLYSGTHGGDSIPVEQTAALRDELLQLGRCAEEPDGGYLKQFASDMLELVEAARREGNPIVFV